MSRELEIPWEEEYVLADEKEVALRKLLPTTEDFFFYHILHKFVVVRGVVLFFSVFC